MSAPSGKTDAAPQTVWVVDDSPLEAEHAKRALIHRYRVTTFADGEAMLEALSSQPPPSVLMVDWHLPGMSGVELCQFVRARADAASLPILLVTSSRGQDSGVVQGLAAGANDYLRKPFESAELSARIGALVRISELQKESVLAAKQRLDFEQHLIGIVSHDLRNPLNAISLSSALLLRKQDLSEPERKGLQRISNSAERAARMIRDLLDFTQARLGGGLHLERREVDLNALVEQVVDELAVSWPGRTIAVSSSGVAHGQWDPDRLSQLITNLVTNACKYSPDQSPVTVRTSSAEGVCVLEVHNSGPPIAADLAPHLFEPMKRGNVPPDSATRSVGLGLYIVKAVVDAHGGSVAVVSTAEQGTCFTVQLPLGTPG